MASRSKATNTHPSTASWHKVEMDELADLIASRTGLNEREILEMLQELEDTEVYVQSLGLTGSQARSRGRRHKH